MRKLISVACIALAGALFMGPGAWSGATGLAHAQEPSAAQPAAGEPARVDPAQPGAGEPARVDPAQAAATDQPPPVEPAKPVMATDPAAVRQVCEDALRSDTEWRTKLRIEIVRALVEGEAEPGDAEWRARLKQRLASEVHAEDAQLMLTNKRHVVMAYGALWILVVVFAAAMWSRQRGLRAEITRLEQELRAATKE